MSQMSLSEMEARLEANIMELKKRLCLQIATLNDEKLIELAPLLFAVLKEQSHE